MLQTNYIVDGVRTPIDTNNAVELLDLQQCETIINRYSSYIDEDNPDKVWAMIDNDPNCMNYTLYLIALNVMETKYPVEFAQAKLEHDADRYEPEYPQ